MLNKPETERLRPNIDDWPRDMRRKWTEAEILAMPRTRAEARATLDMLGEPATFYYEGKICNARKHVAPHYTRGGRCAICKHGDNRSRTGRKKRKAEGLEPATVTTQEKRKAAGLTHTYAGWGAEVYTKFRPPGPEARDVLKIKLATKPKRRGKPIPGWVMDHSVHIGWPLPEGVMIIGREVAANRRLMTQSKNIAKGDRLPDPTDWSRAADRPLSVAEQADFVRLGVAFWVHDLVWGKDGKLIGARHELYADDPVTGLTTYLGVEPGAVAAEAAE